MSKKHLEKLLDFSHCNSKENVLNHAQIVAIELMNNWKIVSLKGERRFWGLEFYLTIPRVFADSATHEREEQFEKGTFYFHTKSKGGWTPPIFNRHGVDITCGNKDRGIYGGILLRHLGGEGHRDGSGLALRSLVRGDQGFRPIKRGDLNSKWSKDEISFFHRVNNNSIFNDEMFLQHNPLPEKIEIESVKRVGIEKTNFSEELLGFRRKK